ncbi:ABC transporter ATP-binding protein [Xylocopilactobacillus apicola]|uniref:Multidrug ABC transporter ATP-binding protein n=1 Tax=Xylocopilactobacillus apicola TaxID=2932184 RepID=A0AAU9DCE1_9LACO|nr:ABC transporter ATP-binding protein [Xylocopilactobacillus apicola]BDR59230.1 multidrug ABC transporter ATP-binding protein [Xylocopilactobacillus apicola]
MEYVIETRNLKFSYGKKEVLKGLNLEVAKGEIVGLIGENGAGKSTLLNILLGVLKGSGEIKVFNSQPGILSNKEKIGSMLQGDMRIKKINVEEMLMEAAAQYETVLPVDRLLEIIGLANERKQLLTSLSGGQMRRVTFGIALIGDPELLFLDEPTAGMDASARQQFWQRITDLKMQGKTIVITSHYLEEIQQAASRLLILQGGGFSFQGTLAELQAQHHETTIIFKTELQSKAFRDLSAVEKVTQHDQQIELISSDGDLTLKSLVPVFDRIEEIKVERQSLEEIFVKMTAKEQIK